MRCMTCSYHALRKKKKSAKTRPRRHPDERRPAISSRLQIVSVVDVYCAPVHRHDAVHVLIFPRYLERKRDTGYRRGRQSGNNAERCHHQHERVCVRSHVSWLRRRRSTILRTCTHTSYESVVCYGEIGGKGCSHSIHP